MPLIYSRLNFPFSSNCTTHKGKVKLTASLPLQMLIYYNAILSLCYLCFLTATVWTKMVSTPHLRTEQNCWHFQPCAPHRTLWKHILTALSSRLSLVVDRWICEYSCHRVLHIAICIWHICSLRRSSPVFRLHRKCRRKCPAALSVRYRNMLSTAAHSDIFRFWSAQFSLPMVSRTIYCTVPLTEFPFTFRMNLTVGSLFYLPI